MKEQIIEDILGIIFGVVFGIMFTLSIVIVLAFSENDWATIIATSTIMLFFDILCWWGVVAWSKDILEQFEFEERYRKNDTK